jgi:hypothetical protein
VEEMIDLLTNIQRLILQGRVNISDHGYDEIAEDGLFVRDIVSSVKEAIIVEEYPDYPKGPCILVLQKDFKSQPVHVVWGIPKGKTSPAVLVTAYRPDPKRWEEGFLRRKR